MKYCAYCGNELADEAVICLNCGCKCRVINRNPQPTPTCAPKIIDKEAEPKLAIWSKITGITSFFIGGFVLGVIAVVLACLSKKETDGEMCSSAKVGFLCGIVSTVLSLVIILIIIGTFIRFYVSFISVLESFMIFFEPFMRFLEYIMSLLEPIMA